MTTAPSNGEYKLEKVIFVPHGRYEENQPPSSGPGRKSMFKSSMCDIEFSIAQ
jgi:hypothetical protein